MKDSTLVNHPPQVELPPGNQALVAPIYQSVKFEFESVAQTEAHLRGEHPGFFYSRRSNPTTRQLEVLLAQLQRREDCLVTASGMGAVAQALLSLTKAGDHIAFSSRATGRSRGLHPALAAALRGDSYAALDRGPGRG